MKEIIQKMVEDSISYGVGIMYVTNQGREVRYVPITKWMDFCEKLQELYALIPEGGPEEPLQ
jgi:hypothetical protein